MRSNSFPKALLWAVLAIPAIAVLWRIVFEPGLWLEELLHPTGEWSARLLIVALMLTPLSMIFPRSRVVRWLVRHRRSFGVGAFLYGLFHLILYVVDMGTLDAMFAELGALGIWTGWLALLLMLPLALTSNERAVRAMRAAWKRLQRLAYPAALLALAHWMFIHDDLVPALVNFAPLILLQSIRLVLALRRRSGIRSYKEKYR